MGALNLANFNHVHFVGIGGIGLSAIARLFLLEGKKVTGSDCSPDSPVVEELKKHGAKIYRGHQAKQVSAGTELVIYSLAIKQDNPELLTARKRDLPIISYPQALGLISADKFTIAVAGTHGKTTTTAMLAKIFRVAKLDPTVIVGSLLAGEKTNLIVGRSQYFIVEACEYRRSFLNLSPRILVITNIDNDHLDYYKDLTEIKRAFAELVAKVPPDGWLICCVKDERLQPAIKAARCRVVDYEQVKTPGLKLLVPGQHNLANARAALAVAGEVGVSSAVAAKALEQFRGTWRRFELIGRHRSGALIYDDYAHHPTEILATLTGARELFPRRRLIVVFQPHLYTRTKLLLNDFAKSFPAADEIIVLPIYAAREKRDPTISGKVLTKALVAAGAPAKYLNDFNLAKKYLDQKLKRGDVLLTLGAGDVFVLAKGLSYNARQ